MRSLQVVLLLGLGCVLGDPDVFDNYFDDELRFVDVPQDVVLNACLLNGDDTVKKIQKAYDKCFGEDYSFDDLADTVGKDSDNDDLPDEYEGNEACFYKTMDWVKGNEVQPSVVEADMAGLPDFDSFKENINSCSAWSGNFGGRKKRAVREASEDTEEVPSIMEIGSGALQWVRSLARRARSADPGKREGRKNEPKRRGKGNGPKRGNQGPQKRSKKNGGKKASGKKGGQKGSGRKKSVTKKGGQRGGNKGGNRRGGRRSGNNCGKKGDKKCNGKTNSNKRKRNRNGNKNKNKNKEEGNGRNKNKNKNKGEGNGSKSGRSGKNFDLLPDFVYNKLWCFDLAMEQALEKCVEDKLNN